MEINKIRPMWQLHSSFSDRNPWSKLRRQEFWRDFPKVTSLYFQNGKQSQHLVKGVEFGP
jgi:hypothetical protein